MFAKECNKDFFCSVHGERRRRVSLDETTPLENTFINKQNGGQDQQEQPLYEEIGQILI